MNDFIQCRSFDIVALIWIITFLPVISAQEIQAVPADSFVESIGVNAHWAYPNIYTQNYTQLKMKLAEAGIRYIRDETYEATFPKAMDLYNSLGIKINMVTRRRKPGPGLQPLDPTQIDAELNDIKTQVLPATVSIEAPNEYDLSHPPNTDWIGTIKNYTSFLYTKVKADTMLKDLFVIGPSFTSFEAYDAVGNLDQYINYVNLHMYQLTFWPGNNGWSVNGSRSITWYLDYLASHQSPSGKLVQATEAGYHNDIENYGLSEEAEGKYTARMFVEFFRRGIYRTFRYELVNQGKPGKEGVYGLLRNDLSEKPSFRAVKNLIAILTDKGPDFEPNTLNYVLNGSMNNARQILFQKRNGDFYLIVWLEVASWDIFKHVDLYTAPHKLILTLQTNSNISNVTLYAFDNNADINISNLPINNNQVIFNMTDKISIIKLSNNNDFKTVTDLEDEGEMVLSRESKILIGSNT